MDSRLVAMVPGLGSISLFLLAMAGSLNAQAPDSSRFNDLMAAGEYPAARSMVQSTADPQLRSALQAQLEQHSGMPEGAAPAGVRPGQSGGITMGDFNPLMNLIQNTIASDSWSTTGNGDGNLMPFLAGVWVDAAGSLRRIEKKAAPGPADLKLGSGSGSNRDAGGPASSSDRLKNPERLLSLVELERAVAEHLRQGSLIPAELFYLGGLYSIDSVVAQPETSDLLLSGRAGPWAFDNEGVAINLATGRPLLRLDDLVTCLRSASENGGRFGCSITPRKKNLAAMQTFLASTKSAGAAWRDELQATVGEQDIEVFGIDPDSHAGRVLVVADHHMKLLGMGIEPGPAGLRSLFEETVANFHGQPLPVDVARWWFTLGDFSVAVDSSESEFSFDGPWVKVLSETEFINRDGERIHTGVALGGTARFARDFSARFDQIAEKYPIYRQLEGIFKMAVLAGLIEQKGLDRVANWDHGCFSANAPNGGQNLFVCEAWESPVSVPSVMNWKELETRSAGKRFRHTIAGVSGGVECDVRGSLAKVKVASGRKSRQELARPLNPEARAATGTRDIWKDMR